MAGNLSDTAETLVRKWLFSTSSATRPTQWFLKLYTSAPSDSGGGTECADAGYSAQEITFDANGAANTNELVFGPMVAQVIITHGAIFDSTARFLAWGALSASATIPAGDSLRIAVGALTTVFD